MKSLIEIATLVTKKKITKIELFSEGNLKQRNSKFNEFYEALLADRYKNDRDAAQALYQCSPQDARYRQLKSRFRRRLLNTLFFLNVNQPLASNYERAHYTCHKEWALIKILQENGAHLSAESMARSLLTTALKFHVTEVAVNLCRILRQYAANDRREADFYGYDQQLKQNLAVINAEIQADELQQRMTMHYEQVYDYEELDSQLHEYCQTLLRLSEQIESPVVNLNMYEVWAMYYEIRREYEALLDICEQAVLYLVNTPSCYQEGKMITFYSKRMSAYLHLRDYKRGQANAEQCLQQFPEGSKPWFIFMDYYLLLTIHSEQYIHALGVFNRAVSHPQFRKLAPDIQEKWSIYAQYLSFALKPQRLSEKLVALPQSRTRMSSATSLQVQKSMQLLQLLIQVAHSVQQRQYTKANSLIETAKTLANRQLAKEQSWRHIQFIRLLQQLKKANYVVGEVTNTEKYLERMKQRQISYRGALHQLEVIPYEAFWQMILASM